MSLFEAQHRDLAELAARGRHRRLIEARGKDFSSNDYLGLAGAPEIADAVAQALARGVPVGSGGSRLLRGNHAEHEALEAEAARYFRSESALFLSSGYAANVALLATLPQRGDLVLHDALVHASAHEGMRLGRAECRSVPHNDVDAFEQAISTWRRRGGTGQVWCVVESLYSMDGDRAPLDALVAVAERHDAILIVDEAHATGAFGAGGRGLAAEWEGRENVITLHTCGKALGCEGALICAPRVITDFLVNRARGFIFSTAPSPLMAATVRAALKLLENPERQEALQRLIGLGQELLVPLGAMDTGSQIMPLIIGEDTETMRRAAALQEAGFDVRGIRPPTVPAGTARLRISLTLNVEPADVRLLAEALA